MHGLCILLSNDLALHLQSGRQCVGERAEVFREDFEFLGRKEKGMGGEGRGGEKREEKGGEGTGGIPLLLRTLRDGMTSNYEDLFILVRC